VALAEQPNIAESLQASADIIDIETYRPLKNEEGFFLADLPLYQTEVESRKDVKKTNYSGYGSVWIDEYTMSDGTKYDILTAEPQKRRTDIVVAKDTAWTTQVEGFNLDVARQLMLLGFPVVIKGPEKGKSIPLSHSAHNTHKILDVIDKIGFNHQKTAALEGFSRGAMIGLGTIAYAEQNERSIIYSNLTDPRIATDIQPSVNEAVEWTKQIPEHFATLAIQAGKLALNPVKAWHYRNSIDLSPAGIQQIYRTGKSVFSGEAGFLAEHVPDEAQILLCFFGKRLARDQQGFVDVLGTNTGTEIKFLNGGHFLGIDKRILGNIATRFSGLADQLSGGVAHSDLDYTTIHKN
jgi:hypothetical protein